MSAWSRSRPETTGTPGGPDGSGRASGRGPGVVLLLWLLLLLSSPPAMSEIVVLKNGRTLHADRHEIQGKKVILFFKTGNGENRMEIELRHVRSFEDSPIPTPSPEPHAERAEAAVPWALLRVPEPCARLISRAAQDHGLDARLLTALIHVESAFDPRAVSPKGAMGLMQLMPVTAARFGVEDPFDPEQNVAGGCAYLRLLFQRFGGDLRLVLAAYNAGEGRVEAHRGVPPFHETVQYISRVLTLYNTLTGKG